MTSEKNNVVADRRAPGSQGRPGVDAAVASIPPAPIIIMEDNNDPSPDIKGGHRAHAYACDEGCTPPTLDEAIAYANEAHLEFDVCEFWDHYEVSGWRIRNGTPICNWQAAMRNWARRQARWAQAERKREDREREERERLERRVDEREARRLAHMDAKIDERERKRERRAGGGRKKADNNVEMTDEVREEVRRDFTF